MIFLIELAAAFIAGYLWYGFRPGGCKPYHEHMARLEKRNRELEATVWALSQRTRP